MTWLSTFYLRAFVVLLQITCVLSSDDYGPLPGFKQQPIDTLIGSRNQSIVCNIRGKRPLKVSWLKGNKILDTNTQKYLTISKEGSLTLFNTQRRRDEGEYRCVVENNYGKVFSRSAKVSFPYMNEFSAEDLRVEVEEGERALLLCYAPDSYPDRNIYWSKLKDQGHFPLQLEANSHSTTSVNGDLYFSYTTRADDGVYYCSVENSKLRRFERRTVSLKVNRKVRQSNTSPKVWEFSDHIAMKDSNFILECLSYGRPIPVMKFRNTKTGIELEGAEQIGNRLRYEFGRFTQEYEGEYRCEVENAYGEKTSKTAYVKMESKPEMLYKSQEVSKAIDSRLTLHCAASGVPQPTYSWFFNGEAIGFGKEGITVHKGNLTISQLMKKDRGFYQCLAENRHGQDLLTIHLTVVQFPPDFGAHSIPPATSTQALTGGTAEINCKPYGAPTPKIQWKKLNSSLDVVHLDERFSINPTTGTLTIQNVRKSDAGRYQCIASNKLGTARRTGELVVEGGLAITESLSKTNKVRVGSKIILKCAYSSTENIEIHFKWYLGRRKLWRSSRVNITDIKSKRQSWLIISNAKNTDSGLYKCEVRGTRSRTAVKLHRIVVSATDSGPDIPIRPPGVKTTTIPYSKTTRRLKVRGPPDPPSYVTATDLSGLNIRVSWSMGRDNGAKASKVYIQARTLFDLDVWHTIKVSNQTEGYRSSEIVKMSPWIEFRIRVISENKYGKSKPSEETSKWIRTPTAIPMKYPTNIRGEGTGPRELTISFDPLSEIDQNAPGIGYIVHYREQGSSYEPIKRDVPKEENHIKLTFINMDSYYKAYEFQVQAKNNDGLGPLSPIYIAYTGERVPLGVPINLKVKMDDELNALASWDEVSKSRTSMRGKFRGYKFVYWKQVHENYARIEKYETTQSSTMSVRLAPHATYYFQVLSFNGAGDGPRSARFGPLVTPEGIPSPPTNFKVIDASLGQVTLTWTEPLNKNGIIVKYILTYTSLTTQERGTMDLSPDKLIHVLKNLDPNAVYYFKLVAVTSAGSSEKAELSFDLTKVPYAELEAPLVKSVGYNAVVLTWLSSFDIDISGYKLFYRKEGETEEKARALWEQRDDIVTTVHSLSPGTTYFFQIAVVNQYGTGPRSPVTKATTKYKEGLPDAKHGSLSVKLTLNTFVLATVILIAILVPR